MKDIENYVSVLPTINFGGVLSNSLNTIDEFDITFHDLSNEHDTQQLYIRSALFNDVLYIEMTCFTEDKSRIISVIEKEIAILNSNRDV